MNKNIQWKKVTRVADDVTHRQLNATERGNINVESGHLAKISKMITPRKTAASVENALKGMAAIDAMPEDVKQLNRSRGGITSGNNAKESGQHAEYIKAGQKASLESRMKRTEEYKKLFYDLLPNTDFKMKDQIHLVSNFETLDDDQMFRIWIRDTTMFECLGKKKGSGNSKWYRKIETK